MKLSSCFFTFLLVVTNANSQTLRWLYQCGKGGSVRDIVYGLDENIYTAGQFLDNFIIVSLTRTGDERWIYGFTGPANVKAEANSVAYGNDGYIYGSGIYYNHKKRKDFLVLSIDSSSEERWYYWYSRTNTSTDEANSIVYVLDGNIYAAGYSDDINKDLTIISLDAGGNERWVYHYNGPGNGDDRPYGITYGADGNIYVTGYSRGSNSYDDIIVISLSSSGIERWTYRYNGPGDRDDGALSITYGGDDNIYIAGYSAGNYTVRDFTVISLTTSGDERWVYKYQRPICGRDCANSVIYGSDGNIYVAGYTKGSGGYRYFTVVSLTSSGNERWVYYWSRPGGRYDEALDLIFGGDGNIYASGYVHDSSKKNLFSVGSLTSSGQERWLYSYEPYGGRAKSIVYGNDGNIYAAGSIGVEKFAVLSLDPLVSVEENEEPTFKNFSLVSNIARGYLRIVFSLYNSDKIQIALFNVLGQRVKSMQEKFYFSGQHKVMLPVFDIPAGVYYLEVKSQSCVKTEKVIITK